MPRASTMPSAIHTRAAPPLAQADGGAAAAFERGGVGSGDVPGAEGVGRGEWLLP